MQSQDVDRIDFLEPSLTLLVITAGVLKLF